MRMLSHQPKLSQGEYYLLAKKQEMVKDEMAQKQEYLPIFQDTFDQFQDMVAAFERGDKTFKVVDFVPQSEPLAAGGDILFFKEHLFTLWDPSIEFHLPHGADPEPWTLRIRGQTKPTEIKTNPTMYPDEFFDSWKPVMLIRHPALAFPSGLRVRKSSGRGVNHPMVVRDHTYLKDRIMYDWYRKRLEKDANGQLPSPGGCSWPVVMDMQDMINNKPVLEKFCLILGLDPEHLRYEWNSAPKEHLEKQIFAFGVSLRTMQASTGVLHEKAPHSVSLEVEYSKWVEEWGVEEASVLKNQVERAMEDYEYLWRKRITA